MELATHRIIFADNYTISDFIASGNFLSNCLEDKDRCLTSDMPLSQINKIKVFGQTAIPKVKYEVVLDFSDHFQMIMPHILNVPGWDGVRIHSGNTDKDTEGCLLLGTYNPQVKDFVSNSRTYIDILMDILNRVAERQQQSIAQGLEPEKIWITIS